MVNLDQLDKQILNRLSQGISSYQELAKECNASRNTIYRRLKLLEERGVIMGITHGLINYQKLNIRSITITANVIQKSLDELIEKLKEYHRVKYIFRSFGAHNVIAIAYCEASKIGETISNLKNIIESYGVTDLSIDVSFICEKADSTPVDAAVIENRFDERIILPAPTVR
jgi:DNA-binding Lrp family transcriptional regulator